MRKFVVSSQDGGVVNWLDTAAHSEGIMFFRWNQPKRMPVAPRVTKLAVAELDEFLPADTVRITLGDRRLILRTRYEAVARRFVL